MDDADHISSLQNPRVKQVVKLRDRRGRDEQRRVAIDGLREIHQAVDAGVTMDEVFWCEPLADSSEARALLRKLQRRKVRCHSVTEPVWNKITFGHRRDGILAVARPPQRSFESLALSENPLVVILDGVEKPGNVGAVCRSVDAVGADGLVLSDPLTDIYNPNAIRASVGTLFRVPVVAADGQSVRSWVRRHGFQVFVARLDAEREYDQCDFRGPTAVVLGSEAQGVARCWMEEPADVADPPSSSPWIPIRLPMLGSADSLNVSNAAAVLLYEALRQRRQGTRT